MKSKKCIVIVIVVFASLVLSIVAMILSVKNRSEASATEIYNQSIYSVVEVKAESEGIGENFGTGEIVSHDGKIITNAHVVTYATLTTINEFKNYYVRFAFEEEYRSVKLLKYDIELDLAVLQLNEMKDVVFRTIEVGNSSKLNVGENVYAVGNASNYGIGIFKGIISVPIVNVEFDGFKRAVIQCDLTIAAGNSGGALLDKNGVLIGITTFRTKDSSGNVIYGIVYCIPANTILEYIQE